MTLPALLPKSTAVANVDGTESLDSEYQRLLVEHQETLKSYASQLEDYEALNDLLSSKNRTIILDCNSLAGEIQSLEEDLADLLGGEDDLELEDCDDSAIEELASEPKSSRALLKHAKALFNKIAAVCHPDKARSKKLVEIFYIAKAARDNCDVVTLENLYDTVMKANSKSKHSRNIARNQILLLIESLKVEIKTVKHKIDSAKLEGLNPIFERYKINQHEGEIAFQEVIRRNKVKLTNRKTELLGTIAKLRAGTYDEDNEDTLYGYEAKGTTSDFEYEDETYQSSSFEFEGYSEDEDFDSKFQPKDKGTKEIKFRSDHPENAEKVRESSLLKLQRLFRGK